MEKLNKIYILLVIIFSYMTVNSSVFSMEEEFIRRSPKAFQKSVSSENLKNLRWVTVTYLSYDETRQMPYRGPILPNSPVNEEQSLTYAESIEAISSPLIIEQEDEKEKRYGKFEKLLRATFLENFGLRNLEFATERQKYLKSDKDRRGEIEDHNHYPNYFHGHLSIVYANGSEYLGSGTLIDKRIVLTAAHNLYDRKSKQEAQIIEFHAGKRMTEVVAVGYGERVVYPKEWTEKKTVEFNPNNYDIGVVVLSKDFEKQYDDLQLTHIGLHALRDDELDGKDYYIRGYPGAIYDEDKNLRIVNGEVMYGHNGKHLAFTDSQLFYDIDTSAGQSGSSVWFKNDEDEYFCCAVHSRSGKGREKHNIGTRINKEKYRMLLKWINEYGSN